MFRIVRLDFWDYRFKTDITFIDFEKAEREAKRMMDEENDPLSCYIVEEIQD